MVFFGLSLVFLWYTKRDLTFVPTKQLAIGDRVPSDPYYLWRKLAVASKHCDSFSTRSVCLPVEVKKTNQFTNKQGQRQAAAD